MLHGLVVRQRVEVTELALLRDGLLGELRSPNGPAPRLSRLVAAGGLFAIVGGVAVGSAEQVVGHVLGGQPREAPTIQLFTDQAIEACQAVVDSSDS